MRKNMKKILVYLLLLIPTCVYAQTEKQMSKYDVLLAKNGKISTTFTYDFDKITLKSAYVDSEEDIGFSVSKISIDNSIYCFITIYHNGYNRASSSYIDIKDAKDLAKAIKEINSMKDNPVPEGATARYNYQTIDGLSVGFRNGSWSIYLEKGNNDFIPTKDIQPFVNKLEEAIEKAESINK